jgi:hypothetical protein
MATDTQSSSDEWDEAEADKYRNYPLEKQPVVVPGIDPNVSQDPNWEPPDGFN